MKGERLSSPSAAPPLQHPIPPPGDPVCMETLQKDKGGRGLGGGGGAGLPVLPGVRGQRRGIRSWNVWERQFWRTVETVASAVLEDCGPEVQTCETQDAKQKGSLSSRCACAQPLSDSGTPWTVARQVPLSWLQMQPGLSILFSEQQRSVT